MMTKHYTPQNFKKHTFWTVDDIRELCIREQYYTRGDNESYDKMFQFIRDNEPTDTNIYLVALDIFNHTDVDERCEMYGADEGEVLCGIYSQVYRAVRFYHTLVR